jgi:hypothetical protein
MEEKFIAYDIGKDYEGAETYLLLMKTKNGSLSATYNDKGKLIRVVEEYKNVYPMRLFIHLQNISCLDHRKRQIPVHPRGRRCLKTIQSQN